MVKNILYNDLINDLCRNEKIKSLFFKKENDESFQILEICKCINGHI